MYEKLEVLLGVSRGISYHMQAEARSQKLVSTDAIEIIDTACSVLQLKWGTYVRTQLVVRSISFH